MIALAMLGTVSALIGLGVFCFLAYRLKVLPNEQLQVFGLFVVYIVVTASSFFGGAYVFGIRF